MAFVYDPITAKNWANAVIECLDGGSESVKGCTTQFNEQIEKLVQPDIWTGTAASQNFQNFMQTHNALVTFTNKFANAFSEAMENVAKNVGSLEVANLGNADNINFGSLSYAQITEMQSKTIDIGVVRYNYGVISSIGDALADIKNKLVNVRETLLNKIKELNSGAEIWDGQAAESAKTELLSIVESNMNEIESTLDVCIKNISGAAEAAKQADGGHPTEFASSRITIRSQTLKSENNVGNHKMGIEFDKSGEKINNSSSQNSTFI